MTSYKIVLYPDYSISGQEETKIFTGENAREELNDFLDQNGYDYNEAELVSVIEGGGEYKTLDAVELTIQLTITDDGPSEEELAEQAEKERVAEEERIAKEKEEEEERLEQERLDSEERAKFEDEEREEQKRLAEELEQERLEEIEKNKNEFNNSELFVNSFKDFLIGKRIAFDDGESTVITNVGEYGTDNSIYIENTEFNDIIIEAQGRDFQDLTEGKKVGDFVLIIKEEIKQEEVVPEVAEIVPVNKSEFRYYILSNNKILAGFEYLEDANIDLEKRKQFGETGISVVSKKTLSVAADDNNNWNTEVHDWEIISSCIMSGVKSKDYSEKDAKKFIDGFKASGLYKDQIKAKLLLCLEKEHKNLRSAFMMSNPERVVEKCDETLRIQNELKRIISI